MPGLLGTEMLAGHMTEGASPSLTVTVKLHVVELPAPSVTRKTLLVTPMGKEVPLLCPVILTVVEPVQLSVPVGVV